MHVPICLMATIWEVRLSILPIQDSDIKVQYVLSSIGVRSVVEGDAVGQLLRASELNTAAGSARPAVGALPRTPATRLHVHQRDVRGPS